MACHFSNTLAFILQMLSLFIGACWLVSLCSLPARARKLRLAPSKITSHLQCKGKRVRKMTCHYKFSLFYIQFTLFRHVELEQKKISHDHQPTIFSNEVNTCQYFEFWEKLLAGGHGKVTFHEKSSDKSGNVMVSPKNFDL